MIAQRALKTLEFNKVREQVAASVHLQSGRVQLMSLYLKRILIQLLHYWRKWMKDYRFFV